MLVNIYYCISVLLTGVVYTNQDTIKRFVCSTELSLCSWNQNQIYFSTTFNIAYMCTYLQFKLLYIVNAQCGHLIAKWLSS